MILIDILRILSASSISLWKKRNKAFWLVVVIEIYSDSTFSLFYVYRLFQKTFSQCIEILRH